MMILTCNLVIAFGLWWPQRYARELTVYYAMPAYLSQSPVLQ